MDRYHRQMLLPGIGEEGQSRLRASHALVVGCGALGSVIIDALARAGVGVLTIVDRDIVEITNLQRQILYSESDVEQGLPKAIAAKNRINAINREVNVHAHVSDFNHRNAEKFIDGIDIILDGLDNFETRYLLNDLAVRDGLPYIYGGAVGTTGVSMAVLPNELELGVGVGEKRAASNHHSSSNSNGPCLRCVFPEAPPPGSSPTCDTAGVLGPVVMMIAAHQATQALKVLTGNIDAVDRSLLSIDAWSNEIRRFDISSVKEQSNCICCVQRRFEHLHGKSGSMAMTLCGRDAVQITPGQSGVLMNLQSMANSLSAHGHFRANEFLLRGCFHQPGKRGDVVELTLFHDGRAIIKGVTDADEARSIYARFIGA